MLAEAFLRQMICSSPSMSTANASLCKFCWCCALPIVQHTTPSSISADGNRLLMGAPSPPPILVSLMFRHAFVCSIVACGISRRSLTSLHSCIRLQYTRSKFERFKHKKDPSKWTTSSSANTT